MVSTSKLHRKSDSVVEAVDQLLRVVGRKE
jgi:hypothetical protein